MSRHGHTWGNGNGRKGGGTPTYYTWLRMKRDILNPDSHNYDKYGGRGLKIDERWLVFNNFLADMGERPEGKTIERIDNARGYFPDNCKWATGSEQARNRRTNHLLTFQGETMPLIAWAERLGISRMTLRSRLRVGWDTDRVLTESVHDDQFLTLNGETHKASEWAKKLNIKASTILARIRRGWSVERALTEKVLETGRWSKCR